MQIGTTDQGFLLNTASLAASIDAPASLPTCLAVCFSSDFFDARVPSDVGTISALASKLLLAASACWRKPAAWVLTSLRKGEAAAGGWSTGTALPKRLTWRPCSHLIRRHQD